MNYAENAQMQKSDFAIGIAPQRQAGEPQRTFDSIGQALVRVRQYRGQVHRILARIAPSEGLARADTGDCLNAAGRPSYVSALEQLQEAIGSLGSSLDELEKHI